jgi:predicted nucleic acid-binding protein
VIVLDASVVVELLLGGKRVASLVEAEVLSVLRRLNLSRQLSDLRGRQALQGLSLLGLHLHEHGPLLSRVWALRGNLSVYDALYVALAEGLRIPLLTLDARLAAASGHLAQIELL